VVADRRQLPMAGAPPRPSSSSSAPAGAASHGPRQTAPPVVAAQPVYAGPHGFQGGWQQGASGFGALPAYRPQPVFRPPPAQGFAAPPAQGFAPVQIPMQPYQQYAGQYVQYQQPVVVQTPS
jgi:hypothetical protein